MSQDSRGPDVVCRIVAGELTAPVVFQTSDVIAFLDHRPVFKGHVLVCPVQHVDNLLDLPADLTGPLFDAAQRVSAALMQAIAAQGTFVAINTIVSQSVPHLHVHVVPRTKGDGLRGFFWPRHKYAAGEDQAYVSLIREALDRTA